MSRFLPRLRAPIMENTGSTARDHLASERTFLSWLRTGLGFIALGMGVERFSRIEAQQTPDQMSIGGSRGSGSQAHKELEKRSSRMMSKQQTQQQEHLLVTSLLGTGTGCILYGAARYFSNLKLMTRGLYKPAYHGAGILSVAVAALAGGAWMGLASDEMERNAAIEQRGK